MHKDEISISEFLCDTLTTAEYNVDINSLIGTCAASPVHVYYKTDKIIINDTFPESIVLECGESYVNISQIKKIVRITHDNGKTSYEITCGRIKSMKTKVIITQI